MKNLLLGLLTVITCLLAADQCTGEELPLLGEYPNPGKDWVLLSKGTKKEPHYQYTWVCFTNSKTGDILSLAADNYDNVPRTESDSSVKQSSTDMFPGGFPRFMPEALREAGKNWTVSEDVRFHVVTLETGITAARHKSLSTGALEYTFVLENQNQKRPNLLAHGYTLAFGAVVIFLQHTSTHIITSDDVKSWALFFIPPHTAPSS